MNGRNIVFRHHTVDFVTAWPSGSLSNADRIHFRENVLTKKFKKLEISTKLARIRKIDQNSTKIQSYLVRSPRQVIYSDDCRFVVGFAYFW